MVSSVLLTLLVLPSIYFLWQRFLLTKSTQYISVNYRSGAKP
jgi:hypothetical protein